MAGLAIEERRRRHERIGADLAGLGDDQLAALLPESGTWRDHTHGGRSGAVEVGGTRVFVKHIALTDLERGAGEGATGNLFGLPGYYQYGVGSAGFGAWRELEACLRASRWALAADCPFFPIVHHWRVLPRPPQTITPQLEAWMARAPGYWGGSDVVKARIEAIAAARTSIVLYMEHAPVMLSDWMATRAAAGPLDGAAETAALRFIGQMEEAARFMNARGMLHFDLHAQNVLTDGEDIFIADFGLAVCEDFDLSAEERAFFETHRLYDQAYVAYATHRWLAGPRDPQPILTAALAARAARLDPVAKLFGAFLEALGEDKRTPFPAEALETALPA